MRTLAIFLALSASTYAADKPPLPRLAIEHYELPNGLKVVLHRDPGIPQVTVCVAYHVGSKNERAGKTGFAHFFEHMMFRGTKNVPNYDIPLQETGAQSNAFTTEDMTVYHETVASSFLKRALYLEAERLAFLPSALDQAKFDTEREIVKNERRQSVDNQPYGLSEEAILGAIFPKGHPYSWSVIGSMKDLNAASLKDLRLFFAEFYNPANACLSLSGDFDVAQAKEWIKDYFGPIASGPRPKPVQAPAPGLKPSRTVLKDKVSLPRVYWAWPTVDDDNADAPALDLLGSILSGGEASRLYRRLVRDTKVAKDVSAGQDSKEIAGLFEIRATAAAGKTLAHVEAEIRHVLDDLKTHPPTEAELKRALAKLETSTYHELTGNTGRAFQLAIGYVQKGDPEHYRKDIARYFDVTTADLARVASRYITPEKVALEVVPTKEGEAKSEVTFLGPNPSNDAEPAESERNVDAGPDWKTLPGPSPSGDLVAPNFVRKTLSNGINVWVAPWKTLPLVSMQLSLPVGTADSPKDKAGLVSLLGSILDKGTKDKNSTELTEAFEALGTGPSIFVGPDSTLYSLSTLARNFQPALDLFTPMVLGPRFDPSDFERERSLQKAGLIQNADRPMAIAQRAFRALLFGRDNPYGQPDDGDLATIDGLTLQDAITFHKAHFGPSHATIVVSGDVEPDAVFESLEKRFGAWKNPTPVPAKRPSPTLKPEPGVVYLVDKPGAVQSILSLGRIWTGHDDPRYFAETIANHSVGEDFLSRLNANLREKNGYSYGIGSRFTFRRNYGTWQVSSAVRGDATAEALTEVLKELGALQKGQPLSDEEIATARDAIGRAFPEEFEDPSAIAGALMELAQFRLPDDYLATYLKRLDSPKPDEIRKVIAEATDPAALTVLVVGDRKSVEAKLRKIPGVKDVRVVTPDGLPARAH